MVIINEILDPDHTISIANSVTCMYPPHGDLGSFDTWEMADEAKEEHLRTLHRGDE
jgi:hypothetical protein